MSSWSVSIGAAGQSPHVGSPSVTAPEETPAASGLVCGSLRSPGSSNCSRDGRTTPGMLRSPPPSSPASPDKSALQSRQLVSTPDRTTQWQMECEKQELEAERSALRTQMLDIREQFDFFSAEVIDLRTEISSMKNLQARLQDQMFVERQQQEEQLARIYGALDEARLQTSNRLHPEATLHQEGIDAAMPEFEKKIRDELQRVANEQHAKHADMTGLLRSTVEDESKLRVQAEERLNEICQSLRSVLETTVRDSHTARVELAEHNQTIGDVAIASQQSYTLLQDEFTVHKRSMEEHALARDRELHDGQVVGMQKLEGMLRDELQKVSNEQNAKNTEMRELVGSTMEEELKLHAQRLDAVCASLRSDLDSSVRDVHAARIELAERSKDTGNNMLVMQEAYAVLQGELTNLKTSMEKHALVRHKELHDGHIVSMKKLEDMLRDELQQVSNEQLAKYTELRGLVSSSMDEELTLHAQRLDEVCESLRKDIENSVRDVRTAQVELADRSNNSKDNLLTMQEAYAALQTEFTKHKTSMEEHALGRHKELHDGHIISMKKLEDMLRDELLRASHEQHTKHAELKCSVSSTMEEELKLHAQRLEEVCEILRRDLESSVRDVHTAQVEMAERSRNSEENMVAMRESYAMLQGEIANQKSSMEEDAIGRHKELHDAHMKKLEDMLRNEQHSQHVEMRGLLSSSMEEESKLRVQAEGRLDKVCESLRSVLETTVLDVHASRVELAEHSKNNTEATFVMQEMQEVCAALQGELSNHVGRVEDALGRHEGLHDGHIASMRKLEDSLMRERKLEEESKLRMQAEERLGKVYEDSSRFESKMVDLQTSLQLELAEIKGELAKHTTVIQDSLARHDGQAISMRELEEWVRGELQRVAKMMRDLINVESNLRVQTEEQLGRAFGELRNELETNMTGAHTALRQEQVTLKEAQAVLLDDFASHKGSLESALERKTELYDGHVASLQELEDRIRGDLQRVSDEHYAKHAEGITNSADIMAAMLEKHTALQGELAVHKADVENALGGHRDLQEGHAALLRELEGNLRRELQQVADDHQAKQRELKDLINSHKLEVEREFGGHRGMHDGLVSTIQELQSSLRKELQEVSDNYLATQGELKALMNSSFEEQSNLRVQAEKRLGKICDDLRSDLDIAVREAQAEERLGTVCDDLRSNLEIAMQHSRSIGEVMASLQEAHALLQGELTSHKRSMEDILGRHGELHDSHSLSLQTLEDKICSRLQQVSDEHHAKHKEVGDLMGSFLEEDSNMRVQADERLSKVSENLREESKMRAQAEERLSQVCDHLRCDLAEQYQNNRDIIATMQELEGKLRYELQKVADEHHSKHGEITNWMSSITEQHQAKNAAAVEAPEELRQSVLKSMHAKLAEEIAALKSGVDSSQFSISEILADLAKQVETLTSSVDEECTMRIQVEERLGKVCGELRVDLDSMMKELAALKSEVDGKHVNLQGCCADLAQQVDTLTSSLKEESTGRTRVEEEPNMRVQTEEWLGQVCEELRTKFQIALRDAHAALRAELAEHCESSKDVMAAMQQAHLLLQGELGSLRESTEETLGKQKELQAQMHDDHANSMNQLQAELIAELKRISDEYYAKHGEMREFVSSIHEELVREKAASAEEYGSLRSALVADRQQLDAEFQKLNSEIEQIQAELQNLTVKIEQIQAEAATRSNDLEEEAGWRMTGDEDVTRKLSSEVRQLETSLSKLELALQDEVRARVTGDQVERGALDLEVQARSEADEVEAAARKKAIKDEVLSRTSGVRQLEAMFYEVHQTQQRAIEEALAAVKQEASNRESYRNDGFGSLLRAAACREAAAQGARMAETSSAVDEMAAASPVNESTFDISSGLSTPTRTTPAVDTTVPTRAADRSSSPALWEGPRLQRSVSPRVQRAPSMPRQSGRGESVRLMARPRTTRAAERTHLAVLTPIVRKTTEVRKETVEVKIHSRSCSPVVPALTSGPWLFHEGRSGAWRSLSPPTYLQAEHTTASGANSSRDASTSARTGRQTVSHASAASSARTPKSVSPTAARSGKAVSRQRTAN